jgi:hypothetical protein
VCGGQGQPCCGGGTDHSANLCVGSGLACDPATNTCIACGADTKLCCEGDACNSAGACCDRRAGNNFQGICVPSGSACSGNQGKCMNGGCQGGTCGTLGQPCCGAGIGCTGEQVSCLGGFNCAPCGGLNEPCCLGTTSGQVPANVDASWCAAPYACNAARTCVACGGSGQPCCPGRQCTGTLTCGTNVTCG